MILFFLKRYLVFNEFFFFSSRRRHTSWPRDWSSDVCSSDLDRQGCCAVTAEEGGTRAIIAAFLANLGIAIAKFVAFLFTGAASMLAEAVHSAADTGNQALLFLGGRRGRKGPT